MPCCEAAYTVGFAGRSLSDEQPALTIPNGINPQEIIFGGERVEAGTLLQTKFSASVFPPCRTWRDLAVTGCL